MIKERNMMPNPISPENQPTAEGLNVDPKNPGKTTEGPDFSNSSSLIETLNYLRQAGARYILGRPIDNVVKELRATRDNATSYFIKIRASQVLKQPLEDYTNGEKRTLLKANWRNLKIPAFFRNVTQPILKKDDPSAAIAIDPENEEQLSDDEVEKIFDRYREFYTDNFQWQELSHLRDRNHDDSLKTNYNIAPLQGRGYQAIQNSCYTRVNNKYGIIYTLSGHIDSFFELDQTIEEAAREKTEKNGEISEADLEFFINKFNKARQSGNDKQLLYYLQIRNLLPENLRQAIDEKLKLDMPEELDRKFTTKNEFEEELSKHQQQLTGDLGDGQEKMDFLIDKLTSLLKQRKGAAKKKKFGYASEDTERLDFFNSFNLRKLDDAGPTSHNTICYYLYLRKNLPENLVSEFEKKFKVIVPEDLKEFGSYDDYLATPDQEVFKPFSHQQNFRKMCAWLHKKIDDLSQKIERAKNKPRRLTLSEILEKEGFRKEDMRPEDYEKLLLTYETLIELPLLEKVEQDFGINLEDYSVREQVQFVNFLSAKSVAEAEKVKKFLNQGGGEAGKKNRVKTFLSLESGQDMGERILAIGRLLEKHPLAADLLFSEYARLVDKTEQAASDIEKLYNETFFDKKIDKNEVCRAILKRAGRLLSDAENRLADLPDGDRPAIVKELAEDLIREQIAQARILADLKELASRLNKNYEDIYQDYSEIKTEQRTEDLMDRERKKGVAPRDLAGYRDYLEASQQMEYRLAAASTVNEYNEMIENDRRERNNFDSRRIEAMIDEMYNFANRIHEKVAAGQIELFGLTDRIYDFINKLEGMLNLQKTLERKLEEVVYGQEAADLPKNFSKTIEQEILDYRPELGDVKSQTYLPVGVSSQLPQRVETQAKPIDALLYMFWLNNQGRSSELMVVDSIQETNFLALHPELTEEQARENALRNGQRDKKWYRAVVSVFDLKNIKLTDYSKLEKDRKTKDALELINRLDRGGSEDRSEIISRALGNLVEKGVRERALDQAATGKQAETEKLLMQYGIAEIAFIVAKGGEKISHKKEYRYDILARVIPIYSALRSHRAEIKNLSISRSDGPTDKKISRRLAELDNDQALVELSLYLAYYRDFPQSYSLAADLFSAEEQLRNARHQPATQPDRRNLSDLKIKAGELKHQLTETLEQEKRDRQQTEPINDNIKKLGLLKKGDTAEQIILKWCEAGAAISGQAWYGELALPAFHYPESVTGRSFDLPTDERQSFMAFREPYSTYRGESEDDLSLQASQVVASTSPLAAAKLMVLDEKKQREYFDKILRPLLVNYYLATSKSKEEAASRFNSEMASAATIPEIIELAQKKIIWPLEMGLRPKPIKNIGTKPDELDDEEEVVTGRHAIIV